MVDYETNMRLVRALMVFVPLSYLALLASVAELPEGGAAILCTAIGLFPALLYTGLIVMVSVKKSETAAILGCIIAWPISLGFLEMSSNVVVTSVYTIVPAGLTLLVARMLWLAYHIERTRPVEPVMDYPVANPPGERW